MAIIKQYRKKRGFVMYDSQIISDSRLSLKAKGLHAILMSHPDNWKPVIGNLCKLSKDKRHAHYAAMNELIEFGYAEKINIKDERGKFKCVEYLVYETTDRQNLEDPCSSEIEDFGTKKELKSNLDSPYPDFPYTENQHVINNKDNNNNIPPVFLDNNINKLDLRLNIVESTKNKQNHNSDVNHVFEFWKTYLNHPQAKLGESRKKIIEKALKMGYSVEQLCSAIEGCSKSTYHMGQNEHGRIYDGLDLILRNENKIDSFIKINETWMLSPADHAMNNLGKRLQAKYQSQGVTQNAQYELSTSVSNRTQENAPALLDNPNTRHVGKFH